MKCSFSYHVICCAKCVLAASLIACSSYTYNVRTVMKQLPRQAGTTLFDSYLGSEKSIYSWKQPGDSSGKVAVRKYYAVMLGGGPIAEMNNMAVSLAVVDHYFEAEIILKQALEETGTESALHNNLGIVYEMTARYGLASEQYLLACSLDDSNRRIRTNFLGLLEIP